MKRRWKKFRYRLEWLGLTMLTGLLPRLPRRAVVQLAHFLGWAGYTFDKRSRRIALANLETVFGDQYSAAERERIARQSISNFARTMCDLFGSKLLTRENYLKYLKIENVEVLQRLRAEGKSAVVVCMHHGNFEWASLATGFEGFPMMIVTQSYRNLRVGSFFKSCREVSGHQIIVQETSMLRLLKRVKRGGIAGLLIDLSLRPSDAATVIDGFGLKICVTFLHAVLVQRGGARVVPVEGRSLPDGTCRIIYHEPLEFKPEATYQQITQQCWDFFEPMIRERPEHWLWAYKHFRYKPTQTTGRYPFYSDTAPEFDRLLAKVADSKSSPIAITAT